MAVLPLTANAAAVAGEPAHADPATEATADPGYALVESDASDSGLATAGYVKGAYNAAIKAINKVATTADSAVKGVQVNGADLTLDANGKANVTVAEGSTNGTVKVNNQDITVHGLGSAAFVDTGDLADTANTYDNSGSGLAATTIQDAIDELADNAGDYATQDGVLATIGDTTVNSTFTGGSVTGNVSSTFSNGEVTGGVTLPIVSTWGATTSTNTAYANSVTGTATGDVSSTFSNGAATGTVTSTVNAPANYNDGTGA